MAERPGDEEVEITGAEKLLAFLLAVFLAVGAIWAYFEVEDQIPADRISPIERLDARDREAIKAYRAARVAGTQSEELRAAATAAQDRLDIARREYHDQLEEERKADDRQIFLVRIAMLILLLGSGLWLLTRGPARLGRWRLVPASILTATATLAVVMAIDYGESVIDFSDVGPALISIVGIGLTAAAMVVVQRSVARRLPHRRVRRGLCPFCGFPGSPLGQQASLGVSHCEGCGREHFAPCHSCDRPRRVGTRFCGNCGNP